MYSTISICGYFIMPSTCYYSFTMLCELMYDVVLDIYAGTRYLHRHSVFTLTLGMLHLIYDL